MQLKNKKNSLQNKWYSATITTKKQVGGEFHGQLRWLWAK
mgnify:FL=1